MNKKWFSSPTLWLVVFGLLNLFSSGRWTMAVAAWLGPAFGLRYLYEHPKRRKYLYFTLVAWLSLAVTWYGATPFVGAPVAHAVFMAVAVLPGVAPFFVDRWLAPRLRRDGRLPFVATLIFPLTVTVLEYLTSSTNPLGNFGAVGYSQYALPVLTQLTAVTGMLGLTFLVSWFPALVNWAWDSNFDWPQLRSGVLAFAAVMAVVVVYGLARLATAPGVAEVDTVTVVSFTATENHIGELNALLTENRETYRRETQAVHARYLALTEEAAAEGAQIVLWPEIAIVGVEEDVQAVVRQGQVIAGEAGLYLGMPTFTVFPGSDRPAENVLFVADPNGEIVIEHVKYGGNILEGTLKGSSDIQAVDTPFGRLSGIICWDTNYPAIVRQVGRQRADILLSPSKEWAGINPMHAEMAVFRAMENGVAVVRQADEGLSIVVDGYGRTLSTGEGLVDSGNYVRVEVPTSGPRTLYAVLGDFVGQLAVAGLGVMVVLALVLGRASRQALEKEPLSTT